MNRNDTIGFNSQYRRFTMEDLKQAAKADTSEASGDGIQPTEYDVLFGRGKPFQDHPGNLRLHSIVNLYKPNYTQSRRHEKTAIAEDVVKLIKNDGKHIGRFLKQVDGKWETVSDIEARAKVSHALRGKTRIESKAKSAISKSHVQATLGMDRLNQVGGLDAMTNPLQSLVSQRQPSMTVAPFASALSPAAALMPSTMPSMYQSMLLNNIREERERLILQQLAGASMNPLQVRQPQVPPSFPNASMLLESLRSNPGFDLSNQGLGTSQRSKGNQNQPI
jgi:hypothetical protein